MKLYTALVSLVLLCGIKAQSVSLSMEYGSEAQYTVNEEFRSSLIQHLADWFGVDNSVLKNLQITPRSESESLLTLRFKRDVPEEVLQEEKSKEIPTFKIAQNDYKLRYESARQLTTLARDPVRVMYVFNDTTIKLSKPFLVLGCIAFAINLLFFLMIIVLCVTLKRYQKRIDMELGKINQK